MSLQEQLERALARPADAGVTRIEFEVRRGRMIWQVWDGRELVLSVPAVPAELPAVLEATELLLSAELGIDPAGVRSRTAALAGSDESEVR